MHRSFVNKPSFRTPEPVTTFQWNGASKALPTNVRASDEVAFDEVLDNCSAAMDLVVFWGRGNAGKTWRRSRKPPRTPG